MATVFVTGSTDGIGRQTAIMLAAAGHRVVLHARNAERARAVAAAVAGSPVVIGDLASLTQTRALAEAVTPGTVPTARSCTTPAWTGQAHARAR